MRWNQINQKSISESVHWIGQMFTGIIQANFMKFVWLISVDGFKLSISKSQFKLQSKNLFIRMNRNSQEWINESIQKRVSEVSESVY